MSEEVYTVEQFAERLNLHPKTVRRFIREGRLRAVKVGRSYRILRSDLEAMAGVYRSAEPASNVRVTSIVDLEGVDSHRADRLSAMLSASRMGILGHPDPVAITVAYDPTARRVKIVIVGAPDDTAMLLRLIQTFAEA